MILGIVLGACEHLEIPSNEDVSLQKESKALLSAIKVADDFMGQLDGGTRAPRILKNVESYFETSLLTRGNESEPAFYLINYDDDKGFVLVSAKTEKPEVYAFSETGNLSFSDTITNPGFRDYLESASSVQVNPYYPRDTTTIINAELAMIVPPILTEPVRNWDQMSLNKYVKEKYGKDYPVGCVALATGQIMSHKQWPPRWPMTNYDTAKEKYEFDWKTLRYKRVDDMLCRLMEILGRPENLFVNYGLNGSSAAISDIVRTLKNFGYTNALFSNTFDVQKVIYEIINRNPVIVGGYPKGGGSGHCWVIDGMCQYKMPYVNPNGDPIYKIYYHFVWGNWGGCNGYFYYDESTKTFDENPSYRDDSESNSHGTEKIYIGNCMVYGVTR